MGKEDLILILIEERVLIKEQRSLLYLGDHNITCTKIFLTVI